MKNLRTITLAVSIRYSTYIRLALITALHKSGARFKEARVVEQDDGRTVAITDVYDDEVEFVKGLLLGIATTSDPQPVHCIVVYDQGAPVS